jgi:hypothetical protein
MYKALALVMRRDAYLIAWLIIVGSISHSLWPLTGRPWLLGLFTPVNESVWEHFKLIWFSVVTYLISRWRCGWRVTSRDLLGFAVGIIAVNVIIAVVYYGYHLFTDRSMLVLDIASYVLACFAVGPLVRAVRSWAILRVDLVGIGAMILIAVLFIVLTDNAPDLGLFQDGRTGRIGRQ